MSWVAAMRGPGSVGAPMISGDRSKLGPNPGRKPRKIGSAHARRCLRCVRACLLHRTGAEFDRQQPASGGISVDEPLPDLRVVNDELALAGHVVGLVGMDELPDPVLGVDRCGRQRNAGAPDVVAAQRLAGCRLDLIAPERPVVFRLDVELLLRISSLREFIEDIY